MMKMANKFTIIVDIDDVCAELMKTWLCAYNHDYNDNLQQHQITDWDVSQFVKPECGRDIYKYIKDAKTYDTIKPVEDAFEGIYELRRMDHRVVFVTATPIEIAGRKFQWLVDNDFEPRMEDYVETYDKSLIRGDYMFDDRYDNVINFKGKGILLSKPWNMKYDYSHRVYDWIEFTDRIRLATYL